MYCALIEFKKTFDSVNHIYKWQIVFVSMLIHVYLKKQLRYPPGISPLRGRSGTATGGHEGACCVCLFI